VTGWLSRGLVATAVGAVLAFAVTVRVAQFDIQTAGAIVMFAGIGYLLVHMGLLGWERGWGSAPPQRTERYAANRDDELQSARPAARTYPPPTVDEVRRTYPPPRQTGRSQRGDELEQTQIMPAVADEDDSESTVVVDRRYDDRWRSDR
jgi:hypothetical protein